jgi:mono/diheme cytochrome c family protein
VATNGVGAANGTNSAFSILRGQPKCLAFDSELKTIEAKRGELSVNFVFNLTNVSSSPVTITSATSSCGCTVAKLPSTPWTLQPGATGQIPVTLDLRGKMGTVTKQVVIMMANGVQTVAVRAIVPAPIVLTGPERTNNMKLAKVDPQAVFKGSCAECHVPPGIDKRTGGDLYILVCGVCHESPRRASMVPNLHVLQKKTDYEYWKDIISNGTTNSLMPAFSKAKGGPFNPAQIESLADFLNKSISHNFPIRPSGTNFNVMNKPNPLVPGLVTPKPPRAPTARPIGVRPPVVLPPAVPAGVTNAAGATNL